MFRISCSSSLHNGCDEPEILRYENLRSVPQALTSDNLETQASGHRLLQRLTRASARSDVSELRSARRYLSEAEAARRKALRKFMALMSK